MNEQEVREYIGTENYNTFIKFMEGQTVGITPEGETDFYEHDVERFKGRLELLLENPEEYNDEWLTR